MANLSAEEKRKLLAELLKKSGSAAPRIFPLSAGQKALWLLHQQDPASAAYNTPFALRIRSPVSKDAMARAFVMLTERHPSLRTTFAATPDGQLLQTVHPSLPPAFNAVNCEGWAPEQLHEEVTRAYRRPFSLERGPLVRGDLFTVAEDDHVLLITVHHIVYDGWSAGILQQELSQIYLALSKGTAPALRPVTGSFHDFVSRQAEMLAGPVGRAHFEHWRKKLSGELPLLALPLDRSRSLVAENRSGASMFRLDPETTQAVKALAQGEQATPFIFLLSAYAALLGRLSGQDDVLIGSPTTGRPGTGYHDVVGYFANPVALRTDLAGLPSTRGLMRRLKEVVHEALTHQDYPFVTLVERLELARIPGVSPIFQASISFQSSREGASAMDLWATPEEDARVKWGHIELEPYPLRDQEGQFDLTLELWEARGAFAGALRFNRSLFDDATVNLWRSYFERLVKEMVHAPDEPVQKLALVEAPAPSAAPLAQGAVTTIQDWFEAQVAKSPDAIALSFGDLRLSYKELNHRANIVARELQAQGVGPEKLVGVCVDRNAELVISILGVLKAGGAYLPLDPASPKDRLALILEDAEVTALVTETKRTQELPTQKVPTVYVDALRFVTEAPSPNLQAGTRPDNAAYVIYTSGSTGRPKGVIVTHANVSRLFTATEGLYDFGANDVWTLFHSAAFDFSVWELWGPLFYGGRLVVVPHWMTRSPEAFAELLVRERVTVLNQTPSAFRALMRAPALADGAGGRTLRFVIFGGEALDAATIRPWFEHYASAPTQLINMYGITETTVHVTYHKVTEADLTASASPIGLPIPDLEIRLLDPHGQPVPVGVPGEIYVGGAGVARGYLKRPELTEARFIRDPKAPEERLYRAGDLAIQQKDGTFCYLGRIDDQVKIRGFRIELGEIQALYAEHPAVAEAYISTYERGADDKRIVAYVVPKEGVSEQVLATKTDEGIVGTHVGEWKELYDELYQRSDTDEKTDPVFNIAGWNSSYSSGPLSAEAMKEWVDHTVRQVLDLAPKKVLEIGCGTGLLLARIAPSTTEYWGTDVSDVVVKMVQKTARNTPGLQHVKLFHAAADALDRIDFKGERFDAVIINSVVQYFPSAAYLARVLKSAVERVRPGGFIFVGDVRNYRLLEAFHASIIVAQSSGTLDPRGLKEKVARRMAGEEELVLDPDFFWLFKEQSSGVTHVEVRPKRGACLNELTRFRYDVVLHVGAAPSLDGDVVWGPGNLTLPELRTRLGQLGTGSLGFRGLRNARVQAAIEAAAGQTDEAAIRPFALEKLRRRVIDRDGSCQPGEPEVGVDPEALEQLAAALSLDVTLDWSRGGSDGSFDAVFSKKASKRDGKALPLFQAHAELSPNARRANDPLRGRLERRLESELKKSAQDRLPDYMVPASIMVVDRIPLTENGKVDRRALPIPTIVRDLDVAHVDPRTGEEEILASIFAELLGAERVGVHDSFFELGGHSLLATQVVSRIRTVFGVDLPLKALFDTPTVAGLAASVQQLRTQSGRLAADLTLPIVRPASIPLSSAQERMWILDRVEETRAPLYVIPLVLRLLGPLQLQALKRSLELLIERHEVLRTCFPMEGERAVQAISDDPAIVGLEPEDLPWPPGASEAEVQRLLKEQIGLEVSRPFDLGRGPLLRTRLFRLGEADFVLVLTTHHIVSDGWSMGIIARELAAGYNAHRAGREPVLPPLPLQYADFSVWQRGLFEKGALDPSIQAWKQRLAGAPAVLELPSDRPRPKTPTFAGGVVRFGIDRSLSMKLKDLSRREGVTLYMTLLSVFSAYLSRISGQSDLVIGSPVANRNRAAIEPLCGFFVNTLPLRVDLSENPTVLELLSRVRQTALDAYADQDVPFEKLVEALSPERSLNRQPLVQVMFALQNAPFSPPALDGLSVELLNLDSISAKFDLTLSLEESTEGLTGLLEYSTDLYDRGRIERMAEHLVALLKAAVAQPKTRVLDLPLLTQAEVDQLSAWAMGPKSLNAAASVLELFKAKVAEAPAATALVFGTSSLSYAELDRRAQELAHALVRAGVGAEKLVAVCLPPSLDRVIAVLAVWMAGGAYLPIDPEYPAARIQYMLEDSKTELLLTVRSMALAGPPKLRVLHLDEEPKGPPAELPLPAAASLAYVIYTSGSTGKPKGVLLEHGALANTATAQCALFGLERDSAVLQFASFSFDASVSEIAMAFVSGARLVLPKEETQRAGEALAGLLVDQRISHVTLPPSTLAALPADRSYPALKVVISAGEACPRDLVKKWAPPGSARRFINAYGPTETTICATVGELKECDSGPPAIGRPMHGLTVHVLDAQLRQVPAGVAGEICVGGIGVGRGYLGLSALTAERFVPDPFATAPGARLYRTGDLGRWLQGGNLEYLGRKDAQVKLRGYRIELLEVEAVLGAHPGVQQVLVLVQKSALVAYFVPKRDAAASVADLLAHAGRSLPDYMVPRHLVPLAAFPVTPNGKIDVKSLPDPELSQEKATFVAPASPVEAQLAEIWQEVLKRSPIGVNDNFFALGGDSILGLQIIARANQRGLRLRPRQLFQHQTIAELSRVASLEQAVKAEQGLLTGAAPLTPIQRWFFGQDRAEPEHFNMAVLLEVDASIDKALLALALDHVERHHDALRLRYQKGAEGWVQAHKELSPRGIELVERTLGSEAELTFAVAELHRGLNLVEGPVSRAGILRLPSGKTRLLWVVHHLVVDAVSWGILLEDLLTAYELEKSGSPVVLQPKTTSFADWSKRLATYAGTQDARSELDAWLQGQDRDVALELPLDDPSAPDTVADAAAIATWLEPEETQALLEEVPKAYDVKVNEVLIAALAKCLSTWTGQPHVRIDLEGHGREGLFDDVELSRTVGWFTVLFPLSLRVGQRDGLREILGRAKDTLRRIPHGGIGYGVLSQLSPDPSVRERLLAMPRAKVAFNYLGQHGAVPTHGVVLGGAKESAGPLHSPMAQRPHRIDINAIVEAGRLKLTWSFGAEVLRAETIDRLSVELLAHVRALIRDRDQPAAAVRVAADFPAARMSAKDLERVLAMKKKPR